MKFAETVGVYLLRLYSSVVVCRNVIKFYRRVQYYSKNCMSIIYIYIYIYISKAYLNVMDFRVFLNN